MHVIKPADAMLLAAALGIAAPAAGLAAPPGAPPPAVRSLLPAAAAAGPLSLRPGHNGGIAVLPAQYASCSLPGEAICLNGWLEVCLCYSYGCRFMATAQRCGE